MNKLVQITGILCCLLITLICFGCGKDRTTRMSQNVNSSPIDTNRSTATAGLKYLALGDSYTIGQSVPETARFPAQTQRLLAMQNVNVADPRYIATTGWTTANLLNAIDIEKPAANFDIVTLLIGVNDQYQHMDTSGYRTRFSLLLKTSIALAANRPERVFVLSIPDYSVTPFVPSYDKARVSKELDEFNAINKQITLANNIAYINVTPASREAATDLTLIAEDGLHPSGAQYTKWANLLVPVIKNAIK